MSNFQFLETEWPDLYREAKESEQLTLTSPKASAMIARSALEKAVQWLYQNDEYLKWPYDTKLSSLIHEQCFVEVIKPSMYREINLIRLTGNSAAHGSAISQDKSIASIKNLFRFLSFLSVYYGEEVVPVPQFDMGLIPDGNAQKETLKTLKELEELLDYRREQDKVKRSEIEAQAEKIELLQRQLEAQQKATTERREEREKVKDPEKTIPILIPESVTRKLYIDVLLNDAGWDQLTEGRELEYEVKGMPAVTNPSGKGYVDYVLWEKMESH